MNECEKIERIIEIKIEISKTIADFTKVGILKADKPIIEAYPEDKEKLNDLITEWKIIYNEIKEERKKDKDIKNHSMKGIPKPYHIIVDNDVRRKITVHTKRTTQYERAFRRKVKNIFTKEEIEDLYKIDKNIEKYLMIKSESFKYYVFYRKVNDKKISKINIGEGVIVFNDWEEVNNKRVVENSNKKKNIHLNDLLAVSEDASEETKKLLQEYAKNGFSMDNKINTAIKVNNF